MREIVRRNDLLLYYTEEFKQCYDFVSSALTDKFVIITKNEVSAIVSFILVAPLIANEYTL